MLLAGLPASSQTAQLRGRIIDPTGAVIPSATVTLSDTRGETRTAASSGDGSYSFATLEAGDYTVRASAPNLVLPEPVHVTLRPGVQV